MGPQKNRRGPDAPVSERLCWALLTVLWSKRSVEQNGPGVGQQKQMNDRFKVVLPASGLVPLVTIGAARPEALGAGPLVATVSALSCR